jgi:hypothetical protein
VRVIDVGLAVREKSGAGMVRVMVVVRVRPPLRPVTVKLLVPGVAVPPTVNVRVDVVDAPAGGVIGVVEKETVTPEMVELVRVTGELKPLREETVMMEVADEPWIMVRLLGEAAMEKSVTATVMGMERMMELLFPLTVRL